MPRDRCVEILKHLRFDDKTQRLSQRTDKFTMIRKVWERFISNCYVPEAFVTIDEQLLPSKSRCPLIQYAKLARQVRYQILAARLSYNLIRLQRLSLLRKALRERKRCWSWGICCEKTQ